MKRTKGSVATERHQANNKTVSCLHRLIVRDRYDPFTLTQIDLRVFNTPGNCSHTDTCCPPADIRNVARSTWVRDATNPVTHPNHLDKSVIQQ